MQMFSHPITQARLKRKQTPRRPLPKKVGGLIASESLDWRKQEISRHYRVEQGCLDVVHRASYAHVRSTLFILVPLVNIQILTAIAASRHLDTIVVTG